MTPPLDSASTPASGVRQFPIPSDYPKTDPQVCENSTYKGLSIDIGHQGPDEYIRESRCLIPYQGYLRMKPFSMTVEKAWGPGNWLNQATEQKPYVLEGALVMLDIESHQEFSSGENEAKVTAVRAMLDSNMPDAWRDLRKRHYVVDSMRSEVSPQCSIKVVFFKTPRTIFNIECPDMKSFEALVQDVLPPVL